MQVDIFEFTISEYQNVISLWKSCEGIGLSSADSKERMEAYLRRNPGMSFVARYQNEIIGAVLCGHDGRRGYLYHLVVHPDYRKRGIGRSLVAKCITALQEIGIQKCHLFIYNSNREGIRFWEKIGWIWREDIGVASKEIGLEKLRNAAG
ncbi:MAG: GNAT family N-acetyltransferase [Desulfobacterales bacterium]|jgi:ribosomal protein S18 acetylase RimI-like enzyme